MLFIRATVIISEKSKSMLAHEVYRLKDVTRGINVLLTIENTD